MKLASDIVEMPDGTIAVPGGVAREVETAPSRLSDFYELTKPRMNFLVVITTTVGFYMASLGAIDWVLMFHTILGTTLTAAGASVLNQWLEIDFDRLMPRTKDRPLPAGRLMPNEALVFGVVLGICGICYLALFVNLLTSFLGAFTLLTYLGIYTPMKRVTSLNTIIGAVPGAVPPMMGFTAVEAVVSPGALSLFVILFLWQMPHFLAIATMYKDDYAKGGYKMLPVVDTAGDFTGRQIVLYGMALIPGSLMPFAFQLTGPVYALFALVLGLGFLYTGIQAARSHSRPDARKLFFVSIIYLPVLLAVMMADKR